MNLQPKLGALTLYIQKTYNNCMKKSSTSTRTINISLPEKLVQAMDKAAKNEFATRSDFIRDSILRKLRDTQDTWELVADFTTVQKGGVSIDELLKRL